MDFKKSAEFVVDGETYMFWSWKGDYINLGAGAETGIYKKHSDTHWETATEKATDMELTLSYKKGVKNEKVLFEYKPYGDKKKWKNGKQWWISGFDSKTQNVRYEDLDAKTVIDFTKMSNGKKMYDAFKKATITEKGQNNSLGWSFDDPSMKATLMWEGDDK